MTEDSGILLPRGETAMARCPASGRQWPARRGNQARDDEKGWGGARAADGGW